MQNREIRPVRVKPLVLSAVLLSGVFWMCLVFDSFSVEEGWQGENFKTYLMIPVVATGVIGVGAVLIWWHLHSVRQHGELAEATLTRFGSTVLNGTEVYLTVAYNGRDYTEKRIVAAEYAMTLKVGSVVRVVVDQRRPERFYIECPDTNGD